MDETRCKKILWQVLKGTEFCHSHNIIHRDIKPENILVSKTNVVKLCDFGFARTLAAPGEIYTDYVATRWYRAPELLVGDTTYGKAVDIWALGCLLAEMLTGDPLFPGDSDIDQLHLIMKCFGPLHSKYKEIFLQNPLFSGVRLPEIKHVEPLERKIPRANKYPNSLDFMKVSMRLDAMDRPSCVQLLRHPLFTSDGFAEDFSKELKRKIDKEKTDSNNLYKILRGERDKDASKKQSSFASKFQSKQGDSVAQKANNNQPNGENNNNSVSLPAMKKQSPNKATPLNEKTNQKPLISPNLPNVHDKNPNSNSVNQANPNDTLLSDKQSIISKRSDNSRRVDPSMNPNPTGQIGSNQGQNVSPDYEPIKSPVKNASSQLGSQKQSTTMPVISKTPSITAGNKQNGSTLASTVTPSPPSLLNSGGPGGNTSPVASNKGHVNYLHQTPSSGGNYNATPGGIGLGGRTVTSLHGGSPRAFSQLQGHGQGYTGNQVQSVGSVVNLNMDHLPNRGSPGAGGLKKTYSMSNGSLVSPGRQVAGGIPAVVSLDTSGGGAGGRPASQQSLDALSSSVFSKNSSQSGNLPIWAGISTLKRSYTNVYKKPKSTELPSQSPFDHPPGTLPLSSQHLPNGTSPRHEQSLKMKDFKSSGLIGGGGEKSHLNSKGGQLGNGSLHQRFSPPSNFKSMSSNNFSPPSKYNNLKLPTKREKVEQGMNELEVTNSKAFESFKRTNHHMPPNGFS
ncbi:cyclin-dependent kinase-like 2 isoform X3 [Symsagittifera roscoffensis]